MRWWHWRWVTDGHTCVIDVRRDTDCSLSPFTAPSFPCSGHFTPRRTQPTPPSNLHWRMAARRRPHARTHRPIDPRRDALGRPGRRRRSREIVCIRANNARLAPAVGLTSAGLDGRTDAAVFWREGGSYCCNSYESARFSHCCQVCECLPCCWISHRKKTEKTLSIDSRYATSSRLNGRLNQSSCCHCIDPAVKKTSAVCVHQTEVI